MGKFSRENIFSVVDVSVDGNLKKKTSLHDYQILMVVTIIPLWDGYTH